MSTLLRPLKIWTPKNFTTANFRHPVSKSWIRHWHLIYFKSLYEQHSNSRLCQKINLHVSYVLERWFVRKIFGYNPKKSKLKILYRNFPCPKRRFSGNCLSNIGQNESLLSPCCQCITQLVRAAFSKGMSRLCHFTLYLL